MRSTILLYYMLSPPRCSAQAYEAKHGLNSLKSWTKMSSLS
jgi:hypothetical protein